MSDPERLCTHIYEDVHPSEWSKRQRIQFLLDRWDDIFGPDIASSLNGNRGGSGLDSALPEMAHDRSVVELQRCLSSLALDDPAGHKHLKFFRCNAEWRQVSAKIKFRGPNGRQLEGVGWKRERIVPAWIDPRLVVRAEQYLEREFKGALFIPKDLWDGLTKAV